MATSSEYTISSLPANVEAERSILGAILLDNFAYNQAAEHLRTEDFSLDSHRRIYSRMVDLAESSGTEDQQILTAKVAKELPQRSRRNSGCDATLTLRWLCLGRVFAGFPQYIR